MKSKMVKSLPKIVAFLALMLAAYACQEKTMESEDDEEITCLETDTFSILEHVMERGKLIAVTDCSLLNYTMKDGRPNGFQYELLDDFCNALGVKLELQINDNMGECLNLLDSCKIDLVAMGIGSTKSMKNRYLLSNPILYQRSVLVQRLPRAWHSMSTGNEIENQLLRLPVDLAHKTIYVPKGTHHAKVLEHLSEEIGDTIFIVESDTLNSMELIQMVIDGRIDYTVTGEYMAKMVVGNNSDIDIKLAVSLEQPIGWAMRSDGDSSLLLAVNNWVDGYEQKKMRQTLARYVKSANRLVSKPMSEGKICDYDAAIRKVASGIGWDWRMMASVIYQESRFHEDLESDKGAYGLMQLMPSVMERYEIDYDATAEEQLEVGGKLIAFLDKSLANKVIDSTERVKFVLASYNCGLGHVLDARRLAEKYGRDPNVWTDNVDYFILNKSKAQYYNDTCCHCGYLRGTETYRFVDEVTERYEHYKALIPE